jgi:hypothetical protein
VKQKEFGVKAPEATIVGQGTWYIDRGGGKSAVATTPWHRKHCDPEICG